MNRTWILYASPIVLASTMFLPHCSSSSSTVVKEQPDATTKGGDSGGDEDSGKQGGGDTGKSTDDSGSKTTDAGADDTGKQGGGEGGEQGDGGKQGGGDFGDASTDGCTVPKGGLGCSGGTISCNSKNDCKVPGNVCCEVDNGAATVDTCQAASASCTGNLVACNETSDCASDEICCLGAVNPTKGSSYCTKPLTGAAGVCPKSSDAGSFFAVAQICRSNEECGTGGKCSFWDCDGTVIESCTEPIAGGICSADQGGK